MKFSIDAAEIRRALELYLAPGQVTELRALKCKVNGEYRKGTFSGYYVRETIDALIADCGRIEFASGVYFVPNPVDPRLHGRAHNCARIVDDKAGTSDKDILSRRWLLVDADPVRPTGISATEVEKEHARRLITDIDCHLWEQGFPPGIIADSGNGWHLTIPVDLPRDDKGYIERLLKGLAAEFDNERVKVDTTVHNPARIWKLPGTLACKGDHCPALGREWRMAKVITVCTEAA